MAEAQWWGRGAGMGALWLAENCCACPVIALPREPGSWSLPPCLHPHGLAGETETQRRRGATSETKTPVHQEGSVS